MVELGRKYGNYGIDFYNYVFIYNVLELWDHEYITVARSHWNTIAQYKHDNHFVMV
jgi:hypothetical protein